MAAGKTLHAKKIQLKWSSEMVNSLLVCLQAYQAKMEFQGLHFDGDRPAQYREMRTEMAKIYAEDGTFGPIEAPEVEEEIPDGVLLNDSVEDQTLSTETRTPNSRKRPASSSGNAVPHLIDNKIRHLEKSLSSAQRDQIFLSEAKEDKEIRRDLGNSILKSSDMFSNALGNVTASMTQLGNSICKSIEMLAQAMIAANQTRHAVNQNLFYQNPGMTAAQTGEMYHAQANIPYHHPSQSFQQQQNVEENVYQSL
eukprot:gene17103-biopygen12239